MKRRAGVGTDLSTHKPPTPCAGPTRIMMTTDVVVMVRPSLCARSDQTKHRRGSHENTQCRISLLSGRDRAGADFVCRLRGAPKVPCDLVLAEWRVVKSALPALYHVRPKWGILGR